MFNKRTNFLILAGFIGVFGVLTATTIAGRGDNNKNDDISPDISKYEAAIQKLTTAIKQLEENQAQLESQIVALNEKLPSQTALDGVVDELKEKVVDEKKSDLHFDKDRPASQSIIFDEPSGQVQKEEMERQWVQNVESSYLSEVRGSAASLTSESQVRDVISNLSARVDSDVSRIECRESLCIIELTLPSEQDVGQYSMILSQELGWNSGGYYRVTEKYPNGLVRAKLYQWRNGYTPPGMHGLS